MIAEVAGYAIMCGVATIYALVAAAAVGVLLEVIVILL